MFAMEYEKHTNIAEYGNSNNKTALIQFRQHTRWKSVNSCSIDIQIELKPKHLFHYRWNMVATNKKHTAFRITKSLVHLSPPQFTHTHTHTSIYCVKQASDNRLDKTKTINHHTHFWIWIQSARSEILNGEICTTCKVEFGICARWMTARVLLDTNLIALFARPFVFIVSMSLTLQIKPFSISASEKLNTTWTYSWISEDMVR